ncbi:MAG: DUF664 domain-containing protein [Acidimicrobiia bacterium]|nr:DUF664 domain-containing protein [Acidimicrobiia bacterium]
MKTEQLKQHFQYSAWASARLVEMAEGLPEADLNRDFGTADKSVLGTLVHVFAADRIWIHRVRGTPRASFIDPRDHDLSVLKKEWPEVHAAWQELLTAETDASVQRNIPYKSLKGDPFETPLWQIVMHVVNHGSHHRGQVSGMLRSMGHTPPVLDLIQFYRQPT